MISLCQSQMAGISLIEKVSVLTYIEIQAEKEEQVALLISESKVGKQTLLAHSFQSTP
jgi:hypothetical protein